MEPKRIYRSGKQEVPGHVPSLIRRNQVVKPGKDITVVAWGAIVREVERAIWLISENIDVELIDLRTIESPIDRATVIQSVKKTGRFPGRS